MEGLSLKPCKCGTKPELIKHFAFGTCHIECPDCHERIPDLKKEELASALWNLLMTGEKSVAGIKKASASMYGQLVLLMAELYDIGRVKYSEGYDEEQDLASYLMDISFRIEEFLKENKIMPDWGDWRGLYNR